MKVVVAQFAAGRDVAANTQACIALIADAAASGADLAILPEVSMYFDPRREDGLGPHGQSLDGPFATAVADAAHTHGISVIAGLLEAAPGFAKDFNTVIVVGPAGQRIGHYRKIHLYDAFGFRESDTYLPGPIEEPPVFDIAGVRVAVLTCYDLRFPEAFRWVVDAGAELVALPAAWIAGPGKEAHWQTLLAARAVENTVYVAGAGQTGPVCCGHSMIVDPAGVTIGAAAEAPGIAIADVRRGRIEAVRAVNPSLVNRRFSVMPADR
jgi:predicted amidohydrolase